MKPTWPLPLPLKNRTIGISHKEIKYSISVTFYHAPSKRFYGSTYLGTELESTDGTFRLNELLYFRLKYFGPNCYGVLELIATEYTSSVVNGQYGCGWGLIRLDFSETDGVTIYQGTPRELLFADSVQELQQSLARTSSTIQCVLSRAAENINQICNDLTLIEDNEIIAASEVVPGLKPILIHSLDKRDTTLASCFGGDKIRVDNFLWHYIPATNLTLARKLKINISSAKLHFPNETRHEYEKKLLDSLIKSLPSIEISEKNTSFVKFRSEKKTLNASHTTTLQPMIVHRRVKFAVHNGHTLLGKKGDLWVELELGVEGNDDDTLHSQGSAEVGNYFTHPLCALVCLCEYIVKLPSIYVLQSHTDHAMQGAKSTADLVTIVLGYHAYIPFDGEKLILSNGGSRSNNLVSLPLINDKTCSYFANERVYTPVCSSHDLIEQPILLEFDVYCSDAKTNSRVYDETPLSGNDDIVANKALSIVTSSIKSTHSMLEGDSSEELNVHSSTEVRHRKHHSKSEFSNIVEKAADSSMLSSNTYINFLELQEQRKVATKHNNNLSQHGSSFDNDSTTISEFSTLDNTSYSGLDRKEETESQPEFKDVHQLQDCVQTLDDIVGAENSISCLTDCIEIKKVIHNDWQHTSNLNKCSPNTVSDHSTVGNTSCSDLVRIEDVREIASELHLGGDCAQNLEVIDEIDNFNGLTKCINKSAIISTSSTNSKPEHIQNCHKISFTFLECDVGSDKVFFMFHFFDHPECQTPILDTQIDQNLSVTRDFNRNIIIEFEHDFSSSLPCMLTRFKKYLDTKAMTIEIWDARSNLHIGTTHIPLKSLVSLNSSSVDSQVFESSDVFGETGILKPNLSHDSNSIGNIRVQLKSETSLIPQLSMEKKRRFARKFSLSEIEAGWTALSLSPHKIAGGRDVCQKLGTGKMIQHCHLSGDHPQAQFFRKLMEGYNGIFYQETLEAIAIDWYRREKKLDFLSRCMTATQEVNVSAPFGEAVFLEIEIMNVFNNKDRFKLEVDGIELRLLTSSDELNYFRSNVDPVTIGAELSEKCTKVLGIPEISQDGEMTFMSIGEKEVASIPCVLLVHRCVEERTTMHIKVYSSHGESIRHIEINLIPRAPIINKSFRLMAGEGELIDRTFQRPILDDEHLEIHCIKLVPSPVICKSQENGISIRCHCGKLNSNFIFLLLIYSNKYFSKMKECYKFNVQGLYT